MWSKHSGGEVAWIQVRYRDGIDCTVRDDGLEEELTQLAGTGLGGIERRLSAFDGTLDIYSPLGGPTTIYMDVPCEVVIARSPLLRDGLVRLLQRAWLRGGGGGRRRPFGPDVV